MSFCQRYSGSSPTIPRSWKMTPPASWSGMTLAAATSTFQLSSPGCRGRVASMTFSSGSTVTSRSSFVPSLWSRTDPS